MELQTHPELRDPRLRLAPCVRNERRARRTGRYGNVAQLNKRARFVIGDDHHRRRGTSAVVETRYALMRRSHKSGLHPSIKFRLFRKYLHFFDFVGFFRVLAPSVLTIIIQSAPGGNLYDNLN